LDSGIKPFRLCLLFLYALPIPDGVKQKHQKRECGGTIGSKSKSTIMKSIRKHKIARAQKNQKEENALDIISKPVQLRCQKIRIIEKVYHQKFGITIGYSIGSKLDMQTL